ncbi:ABC transporter substrate-binding protein [Halobium salinum]|uniref:ABC transporter substrate-binding protein n=1 Tax=Halobium salinum TaxID=1364940 RepID=A0ABD5PCU4_9EURY|nr:ABC transporter substrate-binding protein [Halobium salinum]
MHDDRRAFLGAAAATLSGTVLAGCTGNSGESSDGTTANGSGSATSTTAADTTESGGNGTAAEDTGESGGSSSYTVTASPMGEVAFDVVPESAFTVFTQYPDMLVALGHGEKVDAMYVPEMAGTTMNRYYERLDGVSFDWEGLYDPLADGLSKERLLELDSDVHLADPAWASTQNNWEQADVEEIGSQVAPWFGNFYSGTQAPAPEGYSDYQYYSLWELFGKVAEVFRERERFEALNAVHADLLSTVEADLPPKEERPTAVRVTLAADDQSFYTYHLNKPGYWLADTRPLGANDAFAEEDWESLWGTVDYETMLEADPDVILHLWGMTPNYDMSSVRRTLADDPVGGQLNAVENDRVYAQGMRYQGPIMNLFQTEMTAKQLYPDVFGEWPRYEAGSPYPEIPAEEQLFDRRRVADIVAGSN